MAGRRPKPTRSKIIQGTFRKDRSNPKEPKPPTGTFCEPDWLKGEGIWAWRQLAKLLGEDGQRVMSRLDRHALAMLCDAYQEYRENRRRVQREGMTVVNVTKGGIATVKHPLIQVYQDAFRRTCRMLIEFGLTPAARTKVSMAEEDGGDPLQELIERNAKPR